MNKKEFVKIYREFSHRVITTKVILSLASSADHIIAATFINSAVLAALTLINPILFFIFAFAFMFASGLGSYIGLLMGKKEIDKANEAASFIILILTAIAGVLAISTSLNASKVASFLGASGDYHRIATEYLRYLSIAFFPQMISVVLDGLIMNDGNPKYNFKVNIITLVMNFILNMIFVVVFKQGVMGLGVATLISNSYHLIADIYYLIYRSKTIKISMPKKNYKALKRVLYNGSSDFLSVFIESIMVYVVNTSILKFLPNVYLEAYAASAVFTLFITKIYMGSQYGLQPISSKMMGQGKYHELKQLFVFSVKRSALYAISFYVTLIPVAWFGLPYFLDKPELVKIAFILYLGVGFAIVLSNIGIQSSVFFTSINRPIESLSIAVIRTLILIPVFSYTMIWMFKFTGITLGFLIPEILLTIGFIHYFKRLDLSQLKV
ncbi:MATE family efflux transporter [Anaeromicrobium sediminis]|uniref:MATE family efflux transporter n=1 Tax=Anaeromicrobium sediminis TaxID=1478221 RepID=UPI00159636DE|nr:MATE family efflux transporter [Anaeromicrobium sediminis]